ncbi:MAG: hypothetical protein Q7S23_04830 [bacterium]|nr:hypothetical protein [bacterium]
MASFTPDTEGKPPANAVAGNLSVLREAIWKRRPVLGEIMAKHGAQILHDYAQDFLDVNPAPRLDERKPELVAVARELIAKRLGDEVAAGVAQQLARLPLVSTTDHHGPIDHPFFINANIISALPYVNATIPELRYLVVFSFASVSVNNASAYPRGIEFHGGVNGSGNFIRLPILPDRVKMGVVYGMRPFTREDLTKAEAELVKKEKNGEIADGRGQKIRALLEAYFATPQVLGEQDFASQISAINYRLWPTFFTPAAGAPPASGPKVPDLVYLDIETLVTELLLRHHLNNPSSLLYQLLFTPDYQRLALELFDGIPGGFSRQGDWGSFFFWAVDEKLHRMRMLLDHGTLRTKTSQYVLPFTPEDIAEALRQKKIFPSMLLCYLTVALYYGFKCLGGFCQVHDLTLTKEAWRKLLAVVGKSDEAAALVPVQTKELGGDGMVLSYLKTASGSLVPATGIDMALEESDTTFSVYARLARTVTLSEMMEPMLPEMYTVLYPVDQRDPKLLTVTPEQILRANGLQGKLEPHVN